MKKIAVLLAALLVMSMTACSKPAASSEDSSSLSGASSEAVQPDGSSEPVEVPSLSDVVDAGKVEGAVYTNELAGVRYTVPEGWTVFDPKTSLEVQLSRVEATTGSSDSIQAGIDGDQLGYLFLAQMEAEDGTMPNVLIQIGRESELNGASLKDFADQLSSSFESAYQSYGGEATLSPAEIRDVNGRQVAFTRAKIVLNGEVNGVQFDNYEISQMYSVCVENGIVMVAMASAYNPDQAAQGQQILDSIEFLG